MPDSVNVPPVAGEYRLPHRLGSRNSNAVMRRRARADYEQRNTNAVIRVITVTGMLLALLTCVAFYKLRQDELDSAGARLERRAVVLADQAQNAIDSVDLMQQVVAGRIRDTGARTPDDMRQLFATRDAYNDLVGRVKALPQLQAMNVHDANGDQVLSTRAWPTKPGNVRNSDYFKAFLANRNLERYIPSPRYTRTERAWVFYVERPLYTADGVFLGTLGSAVDLRYFFNIYNTILSSPGDIILLFRDDGTLMVRNPELPGYVGQKFLEGSLASLLPADDSAGVLVSRIGGADGLARLMAARRLHSFPFIVKAEITIDSALRNWRREALYAGTAVCVIEAVLLWIVRLLWRQSMARNVLAKAVARQAESERRRLDAARELEMLIASMPGVLVRLQFDKKRRLVPTYVAPSVVALTGFSRKEVTSLTWLRERVSHMDLRLLRKREREALQTGQADVTISFRHRNGGLRRVHGKFSAQTGNLGQAQLVVIWTDVTADTELSAKLAHTSKLATLGELATGMAHELNQPLGAISMAAENARRMLETNPDPVPRVLPKLDLIINLVTRAASVLDHMRVFGRTGDTPCGPVDLAKLVEEAEPLVSGKLMAADARLSVVLPKDLPPVLGKAVPLEQVLLNLIANACDAYTAAGARILPADRLVRLIAWQDNGEFHICVADHAGGIPSAALPRIFEPFFTTKGVGEGTGLGLSISYGIISDMGGTITASNEHGGAVFHITLPVAEIQELALN